MYFLVQSMVDIAVGEVGRRVQKHVEVEPNLDTGLVQTHLLPTVVNPVQVLQ